MQHLTQFLKVFGKSTLLGVGVVAMSLFVASFAFAYLVAAPGSQLSFGFGLVSFVKSVDAEATLREAQLGLAQFAGQDGIDVSADGPCGNYTFHKRRVTQTFPILTGHFIPELFYNNPFLPVPLPVGISIASELHPMADLEFKDGVWSVAQDSRIAPVVIEEVRTDVSEVPVLAEDAPIVVEDAPVVADAPVFDVAPVVVEEVPVITVVPMDSEPHGYDGLSFGAELASSISIVRLSCTALRESY